jgi:16S rRNA (cytosine1402-N4)-methyltransferase
LKLAITNFNLVEVLVHQAVLVESVLSYLDLKPGQIVLDGTIGSGGHSEAILKAINPGGTLIGLDQDDEAIERAEKKLKACGNHRVVLRRFNFRDLDQALSSLNIKQVHVVLLDIGFSSDQLGDPERGFSFQENGPLDMRMDKRSETTARELLAGLSESELVTIFREYGEERFAGRIAKAIVFKRQKSPIGTTEELKVVIESAVPGKYKHGRIHPATRVFQALRIAVNDELNVLIEALPKAFECLAPGGKLAVISFHSLEDRIVKRFFIDQKSKGEGEILTKKPVTATDEEMNVNPRSRSAKLRVIERC